MIDRRISTAWACSVGLALMLPATAAAQAPDDVNPIDRALKPGQHVVVTEFGGNRVKGRVTGVDQSRLTLLIDEGVDQQSLTLTPSAISTVRKSDSLLNGFLIGLGAGLVGGEVWVRNVCGPRGYDDECRAIATPIGWAAFGGGGAAVGTLIDKFSTKLLYRAPESRTSLQVQPMFGNTAQGVRLSVSF